MPTGAALHTASRANSVKFGDNAYAFEELVAELTAAFLCAELQIPGRLQHPEYSPIGLPSFARTIKRYGPPEHAPTEAVQFLHQAGFVTAAEEVAAA